MQEEHESTIPQMVDDVRAGKMPRRNFIKALTSMGISAAGVGAIAAAAAVPSVKASIGQIHAHESAAHHRHLHNQHLSHQGSGNIGALKDDYHDDAVVEDVMHREPFVGKQAIMGRKNTIMTAASDAKITVTNRVVHGNQVTAEWVAEGVHTGHLPGLPASGQRFSIRGVTVVIRHNGKIVRESLYYDVNELHRQLGGKS